MASEKKNLRGRDGSSCRNFFVLHGFSASRTAFRSALRPPTSPPPSLSSSAPSASKRLQSATCRSQETRVLRRIDELRECADFCGGGAYD